VPYERRLKSNARALRGNLTEAEQKLWYRLRRKQINGWQFYRQKPLGPYIVDFYCPAACLVVEVDGSQHFEAEDAQLDQVRDQYLDRLGLRVLRFDNRQVLLETDAVVEVISQLLPGIRQIPPSPPFSKGGVDVSTVLGFRPFSRGGLDVSTVLGFPPLTKGGRGDLQAKGGRGDLYSHST
jgi:very-short-patch-repair endonuclease